MFDYIHSTDEGLKSTVFLSDVFADKEWGPSYAPNQTAFNKYSGFPDTLFKYFQEVRSLDCDSYCTVLKQFVKMETSRGADFGARVGVGMVGWGAAIDASSVITGTSPFIAIN